METTRSGGPRDASDASPRSLESFRELVEHLPGAVYEANAGPWGAWSYISPQIEELLGYPPEAWLNEPDMWEDRLHPDDHQTVVELERRAIVRGQAGAPISVTEYRMLHRDGGTVWIRDAARLVSDVVGAPFWRGVLSDITAERETEHDLAEAYARYRSVVQSLPVCVYRAEAPPGNRWEVVSPQIESLLGYTDEEWVGDPKHWEARLHTDDRERVLSEQREKMRMPVGTHWVSEYRLRRRDGEIVWVRDRATVSRSREGRRVRDGTLTDITAERDAMVAGQARDVYRLTCSQCGDSWAAYRVEACRRCTTAEVSATSLNATLRELAVARTHTEGLLAGINEHLDALGVRLEPVGGAREVAAKEPVASPRPQGDRG